MDAPLLTHHELVRPWRRATLVAGTIAALELVLLVAAASMLLAKPLSHVIQRQAVAAATAPPKQLQEAIKKMNAPAGKARHPRSAIRIMVFNGNGQSGAAGSEASRLHSLGYRISGTGNARRQDYASSVVMYKPGFRAEGLRLAHDLGIRVVGPLDGIRTSALGGGQLAVVVGA